MTEVEVASRELVMAQLEPLLWRLMDVRAIRSYELLLDAPSQATAAMSEVPIDRELIGLLATRRYWQHHTMREFSGPREEARRILGLIERSVGEAPQ